MQHCFTYSVVCCPQYTITLAWQPLTIPVDACLIQGDQCGQPAAQAYCSAQGFNSTTTQTADSACRYTLTASGFECDSKTVQSSRAIFCAGRRASTTNRLVSLFHSGGRRRVRLLQLHPVLQLMGLRGMQAT